jgi:dihydropteroate synthase
MGTVLARAITSDRLADLGLAFGRLGLPSTAREYLFEKLQHRHVLLTGLERANGRFLRQLADAPDAPRDEYPHFVSGDQKSRPGTALLSGRTDAFDRLIAKARVDPEQAALVAALARLEAVNPAPLKVGSRTFELRERPLIMGVVNVTPDSFSDGGKFFDTLAAISHGVELATAGADILDIGGESTRPGSAPVSAEDEIARVVPVIKALRERTQAAISIDTTKAKVAQAALDAGATLVNDISGFHFDKELARVTADAGAACCLMHIRGTPETMQKDPQYEDVVAEIIDYLADGIAVAEAAGITRDRILVDPGIGFGKTVGHNLLLLRRLADFRVLGCGILVGTSRKAFIGQALGGRPADERLFGTVGTLAAVVSSGAADVLRVHDVPQVRDAVVLSTAVRNAQEAGSLYGPRVAGSGPRT